MNNNTRVVFMGTPEFAVPVLDGLIKNYNVVLVVTQEDKEKDRKGNLLYTPVKRLAIDNNIPVYQPNSIRKEYAKILEYNPDIIVTCAYGQIIPIELLNYPKYGCINVHASLLPKLRGGAPIHRALMNGDKETGITIMYMDEKMDNGDIISQEKTPIYEDENLDSLYDRLSKMGSELLLKTLPDILSNTNKRIKQDEKNVTYGYNINREEEKIDFNSESLKIHNKVRALSTRPGAYCYLDDKRLKIYKTSLTDTISEGKPGTIMDVTKNGIYVSTNDYVIIIKELKIEGKKKCDVRDFINGISIEELKGRILK